MGFSDTSPKLGDTDNILLFKIAQILDAGGGGGGGVASFNARTGAVTLVSGDVTTALGFTPAAAGSGVTSFNTRTGDVTLTLGDVSAVADARYVLKSGDTMTGGLTIAVPNAGIALLLDNTDTLESLQYASGTLSIKDSSGTNLLLVSSDGVGFFDNQVSQQVSGANLTNNVTAGGTDNTIADFTSLSVYATDAAAIRNDIYQLARKLKQINDGLRAYGLFT